MNKTTQSKIGTSETLKARKTHLSGLIHLMNPNKGNATKIENLTTAAIYAELNIIETQLEKRS